MFVTCRENTADRIMIAKRPWRLHHWPPEM